jgi:septum formation protein
MKVILASTSPYRRALVARLGIPFECVAPGVDEEALRGMPAREMCVRLARDKAAAVHARFPDALVIGGDQVGLSGEETLGKPGDEARALAQLQRLRGRSHQLLTAMHLMGPGIDVAHLNTTTLTMHDWDDEALRRYVAKDRPLDCAGAYMIEKSGIGLFTSIEGEDWTAIEGVPLLWLRAELVRHGISLFTQA